MFTAKQAHQAAKSYHNGIPAQTTKRKIENSIRRLAFRGYNHYIWDYEDSDLTQQEREKILKTFEEAGYTVARMTFIKRVIIKW